ncbi:MAG: 2-oxoacid:acceptor oxidoreductase family protein [Clostridiales bacterium]|nr:2-oxoacid:acceptor oxidoreductase family protein [Clostridiales bacterium]
MAEFRMLFAGFGGQGVLFSGKVAAYAGLLDGKEVTWLPSYGPEMRGGTANCGVCISEQPIGSPLVTVPNVLVVLNGPSFDKFIDSVTPGGQVFMDSSMVDRQCGRTDIDVFCLPATQLSVEESLEGIANMIMLGKMLQETAFSGIETVEKALAKCVPARKQSLLEHNIRAVKLGMCGCR